MIKYNTEQRKALISVFQQAGQRSLSAQEIIDSLANTDISMSAVYRNLKTMEQEGLICKINDPKESEGRYHYVNPKECLGIVHFKCEKCASVQHLTRSVSQLVYNIAKDEMGFSLNPSGAFLYGKCRHCTKLESEGTSNNT